MGGRACTQLFSDVKPFPETPPRSCPCTVSRPRKVETHPPLPPAVPGANRPPGVSAGRTIRVGKGRHAWPVHAGEEPTAGGGEGPRHHAPCALRVETYIALLRQDLLREGRWVGPHRALPRVLPVVVHTGRERALTAPRPEALSPLQPDAAYVPLDGPALPDDDDRRSLTAALIAIQSCAEASRMPPRVAGLPGLLRLSGDAALVSGGRR